MTLTRPHERRTRSPRDNRSARPSGAMRIGTWTSVTGTLGFFAVALIVPAVNTYSLPFFAAAMVFLVLCYAWNVVGGFLGELSMAHMIFWGIGAYGVTLAVQHGASAWASTVVLAVAAVVAGVALVGLLVVAGLSDLFGAAIFTLILGTLAVSVASGSTVLGRTDGIIVPAVPDAGPFALYLIVFALALLAAGLNLGLSRSSLGRRWLAIRDDPISAQVTGVNLLANRVIAYALSAALCCLAGSYQSVTGGFASPDVSLSASYLILAILAVFVGGPGTSLGPLVGAIVIYGLQQIVLAVSTGVQTSLYASLGEFVLALLILRFVLPRARTSDLLTTLVMLLVRLSGRHRPRTAPADVVVPPDLVAALRGHRSRQGHSGGAERKGGLELRDVRKSFGQARVLTGVSFTVSPGEVVGVVGPNGAGKSTICNLISGVERVSGGSISIDSVDVASSSVHGRAAHGVGRSFQNPRLFRSLSLVENLDLCSGLGRPEARTAVTSMGINDPDERYGDDPDFYARRLVEVAKAVYLGESVLLLDEPLAGLTPDQHDVVLTMARQAADLGASVVIVEHLIPVIAPVVDRLVVLLDGRIIADGPARDVLTDDAVVDAYLGSAAVGIEE